MERRDYGPFPHGPIKDRLKLEWPGGARLAVWVIPNIEFFPPNCGICAPNRKADTSTATTPSLAVPTTLNCRNCAIYLCEHRHPERVRECRCRSWRCLIWT
jgi:hypothetical protein